MAQKTISLADKETLDSIKSIVNTINSTTADKTTLDAVKSLLSNTTYGLSAIKSSIGSSSGSSSAGFRTIGNYSAGFGAWKTETRTVPGNYGTTTVQYRFTRTSNVDINITGAGRIFLPLSTRSAQFNDPTITIDGTVIDNKFCTYSSAPAFLDFGKSVKIHVNPKNGTVDSGWTTSSSWTSSYPSTGITVCIQLK